MEQILIIEDDRDLNNGLVKALKTEKRRIVSCYNLKNAREQLSIQMPNLIILDENLPDGNGLSLLKELKNKEISVPIIMLTANDTDEDIVNGLELGADDYITKPFSLSVLRARVNTQLRRKDDKTRNNIYDKGRYSFDFDNQHFFVDGIAIDLSKTEQKLLHIFIENPNQVLLRSTLIDKLWSDSYDAVEENALSVTVKRLRDKLDANTTILTVYGLGYKWECK